MMWEEFHGFTVVDYIEHEGNKVLKGWIHNFMRYETVHKLLINIEHWSKLTDCIDDVRIVDSQYQRKGGMRYETVQNVLITIEHWT